MKTLKDTMELITVDEPRDAAYRNIYYTMLKQSARENIKQIEKEMNECEELEREQYLFLAGKRHMYVEFFNINGDK